MSCPCESNKVLEKCCAPIVAGKVKAETAEQLMRARYTAYTLLDMKFVFDTHDPDTRESLDMKSNEQWAKTTTWLGLEILNTEDGQKGDETGIVEFQAKFKMRKRKVIITKPLNLLGMMESGFLQVRSDRIPS